MLVFPLMILKELFNIDNAYIKSAKEERVEKQYYVNFELAKKDVEGLIEAAKDFRIAIYDFTEKLTIKQIQNFRMELKENLEKTTIK